MESPKYSVIIPVYNRPQEVAELLESLVHQTFQDFEVLLIEDGSTLTSEAVFESYSQKLHIQYIFKPNSGPGPSRNFGFERARGEYFVVFDSDCIIPAHYFEAVEKFIKHTRLDAWGGPDRGREDFTPLQRAMAYTMSSVLTTGGIRGAKSGGFQPRSFNMGLSREVYARTGGFQFDRYAEDIELSVRIRKAGLKAVLIPDVYVFHKRRTSLGQFYRQVSNFGKGRILVGRIHPGEVKLTHWFPAFFTIGLFGLPILLILFPLGGWVVAAMYLTYGLLIAINCIVFTRSFSVALRSIPSLFVQMTGYGLGFLQALISRK